MRIDKYLWAIRVFKTRSMASKACTNGHIRMGDTLVKASKTIQSGDEIEVRMLPIWRRYKVIDLPKSRVGPKLVADYVKETTPDEEKERFEEWRLAQRDNRPKGLGRPTKRDRRTMDKYKDL